MSGITPEEIGERIREARLARGWTHEDLARRMDVNWRTVHRWQKGSVPRVETLLRLADVFDLPETYFVERQAAESLADLTSRVDDLTARVEAIAQTLERVTKTARKR